MANTGQAELLGDRGLEARIRESCGRCTHFTAERQSQCLECETVMIRSLVSDVLAAERESRKAAWEHEIREAVDRSHSSLSDQNAQLEAQLDEMSTAYLALRMVIDQAKHALENKLPESAKAILAQAAKVRKPDPEETRDA